MNDLTLSGIDVPVAASDNGIWGSDVVAQMLRALDIPYLALNPGSSFRGLHDSLVNHLGNQQPQMLLCLHEEHAVAVAHGYAKVTGKPMGVILHSNVGLMHGVMAIYNAWCDRVPMLILGATGPVDAAERRPWIDWLHTAKDQGALIRPYVKWDDQPVSVAATVDALIRAANLTRSAPQARPMSASTSRCRRSGSRRCRSCRTRSASPSLRRASRLPPRSAGRQTCYAMRRRRSSCSAGCHAQRTTGAAASRWPSISALPSSPTSRPRPSSRRTMLCTQPSRPSSSIRRRSTPSVPPTSSSPLTGSISAAPCARPTPLSARVISISLDHHLHNGWSLDHQALAPADLHLAADPDAAMHLIADALGAGPGAAPAIRPTLPALAFDGERPLDVVSLAAAMGEALRYEVISLVRLPLGWATEAWHFRHPLDYLGIDGGAGIGSGPGMLIGAALALKGSGRLPVAVLGDGDTMMAASALWTAAHYKLPFIAIVSNNRSFYNDEIHQERVAKQRQRPVENKWIGQRIDEPDIDIAAIARAQGLMGIGPIRTVDGLRDAVSEAVKAAKAGASVLIDARVMPGYNAAMAAGMTRHAGQTPKG